MRFKLWPGEGASRHRKLGILFSKGSHFRPEMYLCICLWWIAITFNARGVELERLWK